MKPTRSRLHRTCGSTNTRIKTFLVQDRPKLSQPVIDQSAALRNCHAQLIAPLQNSKATSCSRKINELFTKYSTSHKVLTQPTLSPSSIASSPPLHKSSDQTHIPLPAPTYTERGTLSALIVISNPLGLTLYAGGGGSASPVTYAGGNGLTYAGGGERTRGLPHRSCSSIPASRSISRRARAPTRRASPRFANLSSRRAASSARSSADIQQNTQPA